LSRIERAGRVARYLLARRERVEASFLRNAAAVNYRAIYTATTRAVSQLKQLLLVANAQVAEKDGQIERLLEQNALLIQRLFDRKSEQTIPARRSWRYQRMLHR